VMRRIYESDATLFRESCDRMCRNMDLKHLLNQILKLKTGEM